MADSLLASGYTMLRNFRNVYREPAKGLQILLSRTQAGPGRAVKEEQEEISPNHVQAIYEASVCLLDQLSFFTECLCMLRQCIAEVDGQQSSHLVSESAAAS